MPVTPSDITLTYSGGGTNLDADLSLGGDPSVQPIIGKRLFDDVTEEESISGLVDYRCFYVNNESAVSTFYNCQLSVLYTTPGQVTVELGFDFTNERQNLTVSNASFITGGSFTIEYTDYSGVNEITVAWDSSLGIWSSNLETALRTITNLEDVVVSPSESNGNVVFEIDFLGVAEKRYHETITLKSGGNNLISSIPTSISIVKSVSGGPINRIADETDADTTTPNNITFSGLTASIGDLRPLDVVPVWVKRIVPVNAEPLENDGFTFKLKGSALA